MSSLSKQNQAPEYWRSLEEFSQSEAFEGFLHREFPQGAAFLEDPVSRRHFLRTMGASVALAGMTGCRIPKEEIVPYVKDPEGLIPGKAKYFASTVHYGMFSYGVLAESHETRPTKIEGNDKHASVLGASSMSLQASVLNLYDTSRLESPTFKGDKKTWQDVQSAFVALKSAYKGANSKKLAILSGSFASPTLARLKAQFENEFPSSSWFAYEAFANFASLEVAALAASQKAYVRYDLANAKVVFSLGEDLLGNHPDQIRLTKEFVALRKLESTKNAMNRLYVAEAPITLTGAMADHRFVVPVSQYGAVLIALANELQKRGLNVGLPVPTIENPPSFEWISALAKDLLSSKGSSLVAVGHHAPEFAHALALAINVALSNLGKTIELKDLTYATIASRNTIADLDTKISSGEIEALIILDSNPVFSATDIDVASWFKKLKNSVVLSSEPTETSSLSQWVLPLSHSLESWGDAKSVDGQVSPIQPLIRPLFDTKSCAEVLALLATGELKDAYELVKDTWRSVFSSVTFQKQWTDFLRDGVLVSPLRSLPLQLGKLASLIPAKVSLSPLSSSSLDVYFDTCPKIGDGRFANNGWLQECPDPVHKIAWDNPVYLSVATAKELNLSTGDVIEIALNGKTLRSAVWVSPAFADHTLGLTLGYGRSVCGHSGLNVGKNMYTLRSAKKLFVDSGAVVKKTNDKETIPTTQNHWSMEGRAIIRKATLEEFKEKPRFAKEMVEHPPLRSLWKEHEYKEGYQWGMSIDLNACTGCSACVIACQSENNIPIVGREQTINQREMHWIRVDRYFEGDPANPEVVFQPLTCQQCENAPCEQVCPVNATVHDQEGINAMVYNRCIGTRYCSNNCPYKVRRFNFFNYQVDTTELKKMQHNPDVTVRSRGVMEKCTFCIQRINEKKLDAKLENRTLQDGEVQTACQQSCPASAISFGNMLDQKSKVVAERSIDRAYELLAELNVKPRNSFLAKIKNPNPELKSASHSESHGGHS